MTRRRTAHGAFIAENFGSIWPVHLSAFTLMLTRLRRHFNGDLDLLLIMAIIGERTRPDHWTPDLTEHSQLTRAGDGAVRQLPINVQSIAEYAQIPRETVRRKVKVLQDKGLVRREADGRLTVSPDAGRTLEHATEDALSYLEALRAAFEAAERPGKRD